MPVDATADEKAWADKDFSWQTRLWIDDMFMITIIQSQAYKATGKREYIDRAASEMVMYLDELQRPNGLFYHAPDVPCYLPKDNLDRPRIVGDYHGQAPVLWCCFALME